jgi:hypothetical protein
VLDFLPDKLVRLAEERAALRVAEDAPGDSQVDQGLGRDLVGGLVRSGVDGVGEGRRRRREEKKVRSRFFRSRSRSTSSSAEK